MYYFIKDESQKDEDKRLEFWSYGGMFEFLTDEIPVHVDDVGNVVDDDGGIVLPAGQKWPKTCNYKYRNLTLYTKKRKDLTDEEKRAINRYNRRKKRKGLTAFFVKY